MENTVIFLTTYRNVIHRPVMIKQDLIRLISDEKDEHRYTHQYRFVVRKCDTCPINSFPVIFFLLPHENVLQRENDSEISITVKNYKNAHKI